MKILPTIKEIMTPNPIALNLDSSIADAINIISNHKFDHLPILDEQGIFKGIISKTDLYHNALQLSQSTSGKSYSQKQLNGTKVKEGMTYDPIYITTDKALEYAIELFLQDKFHALPVLENDKLVGIITPKDILYQFCFGMSE